MENSADESKPSVTVLQIPDGNVPTTSKDGEFFQIANEGTAPMDEVTEFLLSVMSKNCEDALEKCKKILQREPNNQMFEEFYHLLLELAQDVGEHEDSSESSLESWGFSSSDDDEKGNDQHLKSSSSSEISSSESASD